LTGILLVNLGTPDAPDAKKLRPYLKQFLMDPRVLDISALARWIIVHLFILPRRPVKSAAAYKKVWTERGSPLLFHARDLQQLLQQRCQETVQVEIAMRYGNPTLTTAMQAFEKRGISRVIVFPLFPQYSSAAFGSAVEAIYRYASAQWNTPFISIVPPYFNHPAFIDAFAGISRQPLEQFGAQKVVFIFH